MKDREHHDVWTFTPGRGGEATRHEARVSLSNGAGLVKWVAINGLSVRLFDPAVTDNRFDPTIDCLFMEEGKVVSSLTVPILDRQDDVMGVIHWVNRKTGTLFTHTDEEVAKTLSAQVAVAMLNCDRHLTTGESLKSLSRVLKVTEEIYGLNMDVPGTCAQAALIGKRLLRAERCIVYIKPTDTDGFILSMSESPPRRVELGNGIAGRVAQHGKAINFIDPTNTSEESGKSIICIPLMDKDGVKPVGAIQAIDKDGGKGCFDNGDMEAFTQFAVHVRAAITASRKLHELQRTANQLERIVAMVPRAAVLQSQRMLQAVTQVISEDAASILPADRCQIFIIDTSLQRQTSEMMLFCAHESWSRKDAVRISAGVYVAGARASTASIVAKVAQTGQIVSSIDTPDLAVLAVPLIGTAEVHDLLLDSGDIANIKKSTKSLKKGLESGGSVIGVMLAVRFHAPKTHAAHGFTARDSEMLERLAIQSAAAISSHRILKRAEEAKDLLTRILDSLPYLVLVLDNAGRLLVCNGDVKEILGVDGITMSSKPYRQWFDPMLGTKELHTVAHGNIPLINDIQRVYDSQTIVRRERYDLAVIKSSRSRTSKGTALASSSVAISYRINPLRDGRGTAITTRISGAVIVIDMLEPLQKSTAR